MRGFNSYFQEAVLSESLNTPIEFELTDDTQIPSAIYGVFKQDEDTYGMSLEQSTYEGIYLLKFYRILNKQARQWSFKKPTHIRPGLSTLIKFAEAVTPFVKSKMRGIICTIPGENSARYIQFAERVVKRSYITSFRVLPATKSPDKKIYDWEQMFLVRRDVSPASVFVDSKFKKYNFDGIITHEIVADLKPKKPTKKSLSTKASKTYVIQNDLKAANVVVDDEMFDKITKIEKVKQLKVTTEKSEIQKKIELYDFQGTNLKIVKSIEKSKQLAAADGMNYALKNPIETMIGLIEFTGYNVLDSSSAKTKTPAELFDENFIRFYRHSFNSVLVHFLISNGFLRQDSSNGDYLIPTPLMKTTFIEAVKIIRDRWIDSDANSKVVKSSLFFEKFASTFSYQNMKSDGELAVEDQLDVSEKETFLTNVDPETLSVTLPGSGVFSYSYDVEQMMYGDNFTEAFDPYTMVSHVEKNLGYFEHLQTLVGFKDAVKYTGKDYKHMNWELRNVFSNYMNALNPDPNMPSWKKQSAPSWKALPSSVSRMTKMFDKVKPFPESMWLYRSTELPSEIREKLAEGEDFMDPAFMSTTIKPSMNFGGSSRFRIYVPAGSKVIPILNHSSHEGEMEVILPPMSILKIIRLDKQGYRSFYTAIYVGSAYEDFRKKITINESLLFENKKPKEEYDPADKYKGTTDEKILLSAMQYVNQKKKEFKK
jgi:hypothetical protein